MAVFETHPHGFMFRYHRTIIYHMMLVLNNFPMLYGSMVFVLDNNFPRIPNGLGEVWRCDNGDHLLQAKCWPVRIDLTAVPLGIWGGTWDWFGKATLESFHLKLTKKKFSDFVNESVS